jgi:putative ABC transport system ATP-binding protein
MSVNALNDHRREPGAVVGVEQVPTIALSRLGRTYPGIRPVHALDEVDLTLRQGEYAAIVGPSGSGKSTLLNVLGLLDRPTSGTYLLDGIDVGSLSEDSRTALRGQRIGFVFQAFHLLEHRSARENVELAMLYNGPFVASSTAERSEQAKLTLRSVGLGHRLEARPSTMSGGERQRVAIARAIVNRPSLVLCDEPTGNLDTHTADSVMKVLESLNAAGQTIVIITHDPSVSARARTRHRIVDGHLSTDLT